MSRFSIASLVATLAAVVALSLAADARAGSDLWSRATEGADDEQIRHTYDENMRLGDELTVLASSDAARGGDRRRVVLRAILAYENAAQARPDAAEPHYRAGMVIHAFFIECDRPTTLCNPVRAPQREMTRMLDHWAAFERLAPLDPRIDGHFLFARAILHTRVGTPEHIELALADYAKILARGDLAAGAPLRTPFEDWSVAYSNMAETYMMLGRLDEAIPAYREALRFRSDTGQYYGLAVALDRDEQGAQAREIMVALGRHAFEAFQQSVALGETFYVPEEERYYYFALAAEALGQIDQAITFWDLYVRSGVYPQYQARARANRDALLARRGKKP
jgi:tetratricopeptide (TPR) repeat protein